MVTDEQVRLLMSLINKGMPQVTAAAKAGMRADGAQVPAFGSDAFGAEGATDLADTVGSVRRGVAGDRVAAAAGWWTAGEDGVG